MLLQHGEGIYSPDRKLIIDRPDAVRTLQFFVDMFNEHNVAWPIRDQPSLRAAIKRDEVMSFVAADWFVVLEACARLSVNTTTDPGGQL